MVCFLYWGLFLATSMSGDREWQELLVAMLIIALFVVQIYALLVGVYLS